MAELPKGFHAAGAACGLKRDPNRLDISLIVCDQPSVAAGVYTRNLVCAAPVILDRERTPSSKIRAVITNSGNANACTGKQGMRDATSMAEITARAIGCEPEQVLVMSTGVIGQPLDITRIEGGIHSAASKLSGASDGLAAAAQGILTTDTVEKIATAECDIDGLAFTITGIAKGSGMIAPNMATMLAVVMTDANISQSAAQELLGRIAERTFNRISVDGHTSTNDTVLLFASGKVSDKPLQGEPLRQLSSAIEAVCTQLARAIVRDGEGAQHVVEIRVGGCATDDDAFAIAQAVGNSPLVKTAFTGCDPNWGRIVSAAGYAGPQFDPEGVSLSINGVQLYRDGMPIDFDDAAVSESMQQPDVLVELTFSEGGGRTTFWTCDLTREYIRINAEYRT